MKIVLVVDDDPSVYEAIKIILAPEKTYKVIYIDSADSALKKIGKGFKPDIIFLDLVMPNVSGLAFLDAVRSMRIKTKIIMVSHIDKAKAAAEAIKKGAKDYIVKPFSAQEIIEKLKI